MDDADPTLLVLKPGAISLEDKEVATRAGIIVIEVDDPSSVRLLKANAEISGSDMLRAAMKALYEGDSIDGARRHFALNIAATIMKKP